MQDFKVFGFSRFSGWIAKAISQCPPTKARAGLAGGGGTRLVDAGWPLMDFMSELMMSMTQLTLVTPRGRAR